MKGSMVGRLEGLEGWKVSEKVGRFKGFCRFPYFQKLLDRAERPRRVTVFEQRSHLGPPAEGRPGPSDPVDDHDHDADADDQ